MNAYVTWVYSRTGINRVVSVSSNEMESIDTMNAIATLPESVRGGKVRRTLLVGSDAKTALRRFGDGENLQVRIDINNEGQVIRTIDSY